MKKWLFSFALLAGFLPVILAQTLSPSIISPNGGIAENSIMILEWTIGETAVETYRSGKEFYTEGFHQPSLVVKPSDQMADIAPRTSTTELTNGIVRVMPNPVYSVLTVHLELDHQLDLQISILDMHGQILNTRTATIDKGDISLDFTKYPSGMYMLHVNSSDGSVVYICNVTKI